ncbi:MAG: nucleotidyltransferase domain-containing protein [Campylobacterota bacterium]|nr:nucleotidyltransferase domain-containing protein [Campylobacterota bacterium]
MQVLIEKAKKDKILTSTIILEKLKELKPIFEKEDIKLLGLFGSYSRDEANKDSDIDILIETTPKFLKKHWLECYCKT